MLTQLRTIFDLIIQFQNAQESFFSAATTEMQSRQRLEKAVELRTDEGSMDCLTLNTLGPLWRIQILNSSSLHRLWFSTWEFGPTFNFVIKYQFSGHTVKIW